jgi:hypothetical protein
MFMDEKAKTAKHAARHLKNWLLQDAAHIFARHASR